MSVVAMVRHCLKLWALAGLLALVSGTADAAAPALAQAPLLLHEAGLSFWRDESAGASLEGALHARNQGAFAPLTGPLGLGYVEETVWLYFELDGPSAGRGLYLLEVLPPSLDLLTLYTEDRAGAWQVVAERGDTRPQATTPFPSRHPLFPLELGPGRHAFLLSLQSQGPLQGLLKLWPQAAWQAEARQTYLWLGFRYGVGFLFFFVNLAYWPMPG